MTIEETVKRYTDLALKNENKPLIVEHCKQIIDWLLELRLYRLTMEIKTEEEKPVKPIRKHDIYCCGVCNKRIMPLIQYYCPICGTKIDLIDLDDGFLKFK